MLKVDYKNKKYYFLLQFRAKFMAFRYLSFLKASFAEVRVLLNALNKQSIAFVQGKERDFSFLFKNKNLGSNWGYNLWMVGHNDYFLLNDIQQNLNGLLYSGHFINVLYFNKLDKFFMFHKRNYNNFVHMVLKNLIGFTFFLLFSTAKFLVLANFAGMRKII